MNSKNNIKCIPQNNIECIPQNNMDCYYNNKWKQTHKLSNNDPSLNNFTMIQDKIDDEMYQFIIDTKYGSDKILNNLIKLRESYFNRDDKSAKIIKLVNHIKNITNITELANVIYAMNNLNIPTFFTMTVMPHFKKPDIYVIALGEIPLLMGSMETYNNQISIFMKNYVDILENIYQLVNEKWNYNVSEIIKFVHNIIVFESVFSKANLSFENSINPLVTHNSMTYIDFLKRFDTNNFWKIIFGKYISNDLYIFYENEFSLNMIKNYLQDMMNDDLQMMKDYLVFCLAKKFGPYTSIADSFNTILISPPNEKEILVQIFYDTFGYYLQSLYESKYSDPKKNTAVYEMFNNMKTYCVDIFEKTNIFTNDTKNEALKKLKALDMVIGKQCYAIDLMDMPDLGNDFYENLLVINFFYFRKMAELIGKNKNRYYLSIGNDLYSFMVNAYYDPISNIIYVPTSIIDDIFFKLDNDPIYNYGSLGSIIGHELMHCFDNTGALYDYNGHLNNWWISTDYEKFNNEVIKIKNHYSNISLNGNKLNAEVSASENIADITGLKLSLRTYIKKYMPSINVNHLNYNINEKEHLKKFFESWTKTLRTIDSDDVIKHQIKSDVHAPSIVRVNAPFSHIDEYYNVYDVKPNHLNYLEPKLRSKFLDT